jgi:hypothetical protein
MEKTGSFEYVVFKKEGKVWMRSPGGSVIIYDNRFSDCPLLSEGQSFIKVKEDCK